MPIRMVKDENGNLRPKNVPNTGGGSSGGSGCLTMLLPILMKNPKLLIPIMKPPELILCVTYPLLDVFFLIMKNSWEFPRLAINARVTKSNNFFI